MMLIAFSSFAVASDFTEPFGDITTTGCDAAWYGGCEVGWSATGANNTLEVCDDDSEYGVLIVPASSTNSGFSKNVTGVE